MIWKKCSSGNRYIHICIKSSKIYALHTRLTGGTLNILKPVCQRSPRGTVDVCDRSQRLLRCLLSGNLSITHVHTYTIRRYMYIQRTRDSLPRWIFSKRSGYAKKGRHTRSAFISPGSFLMPFRLLHPKEIRVSYKQQITGRDRIRYILNSQIVSRNSCRIKRTAG